MNENRVYSCPSVTQTKAPNASILQDNFYQHTALNRRGFLASSIALCGVHASSAQARSIANPLFVMSNWFYFADPKPSWQDRLAFLKSQGVNAISFSLGSENRWDEFNEVIELCQAMDVEMTTVYQGINIDDKTISPLMVKLIERLKGQTTKLQLNLTSKAYQPSDPAGDASAAAALENVAKQAFDAGLSITLYPHCFFWGERASDMARLAKQFNDPRLRITFNLYHWLKVEGPDNGEKAFESALPYLDCVTINGSFKHAKTMDVRDGIVPLGEGDYDVHSFVKSFKQAGFRGPVGLIGYGIDGDVLPKLAKSIAVWKAWRI